MHGLRGKREVRQTGNTAFRRTVEVRVRLSADAATRLGVLAAIRGKSPGELVEWALLPHLAFDLPEPPDVAVEAIGARRREGKKTGGGGGDGSG